MADTPLARTPADLMAPLEVGAPSPLPPHVAAELDATTNALQDAFEAHNAAFGDVTDAIHRELAPASSESNLAVAELAGTLDSALRAAETPHYAALDKLSDSLTRQVIYAQEDLRAQGVLMPTSADDARAVLDDATGEMLMSQLLSDPFDAVAVPAPPAFPLPTTSEPGYQVRETPRTVPDFIPPEKSTLVYDAEVSPPVVPPYPPPPPPPPSTSEPSSSSSGTKESCPPKPCPPPAEWPRSEVCPTAKPFYESDPDSAVADGRAFRDPFTLKFYYTDGVDPKCVPPPLPPLDPCLDRAARGKDKCPDPPIDLTPKDFTIPAVPAVATEGFGLIWSADDVCKRVDATFVRGLPRPLGPPPLALEKKADASTLVGRIYDWGIDVMRVTVGEVNRIKLDEALIGEAATWLAGAAVIEPIWATLDLASVPDREAASRLASKIGLARMAERRTGVPMDYLATTEQYLLQYTAPQYIPEQSGLDLAYLRDEISGDQWACLTRANGNVVKCAEWVLDARQTRPDVSEVVALYRRGAIKDRAALHDRMRELGVLDKLYEDNYLKLSEWIPTPPDVVRFMVRDVFDQNAVDNGNYDKDFEAKYYGQGGRANPGPAAKYMQAFGIGEDEAKLFWRAHWEMPSATQLYQMLHRLRFDRPEIDAWVKARQAAPDGNAFERANPQPFIMTMAKAREVLEIDDKAPAYIDALLAVSYNPMTRTDAIAAFMANEMDAEELRHRFLDTGMDDATAKRVVQIQTNLRARRFANLSGVWTVRKIIAEYQAGGITAARADALLQPLVSDAAQRQALIAGADAEMEAHLKRAKVKALYKRFVMGYHNNGDAVQQLQQLGHLPQYAQTMVDTWDQERRAPRREATAKMIVEWVQQRILAPENAFIRLANLGYSSVDANMIVYGATIKAGEKIETGIRQAKADTRAIIRDMKQAARTATRDLSQREKDLAKQISDLEKERARIEGELATRRA